MRRIMRVAHCFDAIVEQRGFGIVGQGRVEIDAAAEPALCGDEEAGVHVDGRHQRVGRVDDQADAGGKKARVFGGAVYLLGEIGRELAMYGRNIDTGLFKGPALHHRHDPAAAMFTRRVGAVPGSPFEAASRTGGTAFVFKGFQGGTNLVAQITEPALRGGLLFIQRVHGLSLTASPPRVKPCNCVIPMAVATLVPGHPLWTPRQSVSKNRRCVTDRDAAMAMG